jgi:hypothetical protein
VFSDPDTAFIEELVIHEGVEALPARAFKQIETLRTVSLPDSLREIGNKCFRGTSLTTIRRGARVSDSGWWGPYVSVEPWWPS